MKFFHKVALCHQIENTLLLRKRRYSILRLASENQKQLNRINTLLKVQKSPIICLRLSFEHCFKKMFPALRYLRILQILPKTESRMTGKEINILAEQIGRSFKSLQKLRLGFNKNQNLTDSRLINLAERIGKNHSLQHLDLNFLAIPVISDFGVKWFAEHIGNNLKSLGHLSLDFSFANITDVGFSCFAENIGKFKHLRQLRLRFVNVHRIANKGFICLAKSIGTLKDLQHLCLHFFFRNSISETGLIALAKNVASHRDSIQKFYLAALERSWSSVQELLQWAFE